MKFLAMIPVLGLVCYGCMNMSNSKADDAKGQAIAADYNLAAKVKVAIVSEPSLSPSSRFVTVGADNGVITLSGQVANQADADKILSIAENVEGVKSVNDEMTVAGS